MGISHIGFAKKYNSCRQTKHEAVSSLINLQCLEKTCPTIQQCTCALDSKPPTPHRSIILQNTEGCNPSQCQIRGLLERLWELRQKSKVKGQRSAGAAWDVTWSPGQPEWGTAVRFLTSQRVVGPGSGKIRHRLCRLCINEIIGEHPKCLYVL